MVMAEMYKRIHELCKANKMSVSDMCRELKIPRSVLSELSSGRTKTLSSINTNKIANRFNVSTSYLLDGSQKEKPTAKNGEPDITFDDFTYALHNESKELTEENKQKLLEMARIFKLAQDQEKKKNDK